MKPTTTPWLLGASIILGTVVTRTAASTPYSTQCKPREIGNKNASDVQLVPPLRWDPENVTFTPAVVEVVFNIRDVPAVDDDKQFMAVSFFLIVKWRDERLADDCEFSFENNFGPSFDHWSSIRAAIADYRLIGDPEESFQ